MFENTLKTNLKAGKKTIGAWAQLASPFTTEIMSTAGFDWLMLDHEHAPGDILTLISQIQAMKGTSCTPLVRAPWNDFVAIKKILDAGAQGLLIPYVNTREETEQAVKACKYPLEGIRGVAGSPRAAGYGQNIGSYLQRRQGPEARFFKDHGGISHRRPSGACHNDLEGAGVSRLR